MKRQNKSVGVVECAGVWIKGAQITHCLIKYNIHEFG